MGRVNALFMEQQEQLMADYMVANPNVDEEEAYFAIFGEPYDPEELEN